MSDEQTVLLYVLSTLAQTCAALAAFVGAVGIFRMQRLRNGANAAERALRRLARLAGMYGPAITAVPLVELAEAVTRLRGQTKPDNRYYERVQGAGRALDTLSHFNSRLRTSRCALTVFEAWNLLVIFAALVGFNHVTALAACPWTLLALWPVALVTVGVTVVCVVVWTKE